MVMAHSLGWKSEQVVSPVVDVCGEEVLMPQPLEVGFRDESISSLQQKSQVC